MVVYHVRQWFRRRRFLAAAVYYPVASKYEVFSEPRRPFWQRWMESRRPSLDSLRQDLRRIASDRRVSHVVLELQAMAPQWPRLAVLRDEIANLQREGKHVSVWAKHYDLASLYAVGTADALYLQPGGHVAALGRQRTYLFFKEALASLGLQFHAVTTSGFKTAADMLTRSSMSAELRQMAQWIMDSEFSAVLAEIAAGRSVPTATVEQWCEDSPFTDEQALAAGIITGIVGQDDLGPTIAPERPLQMSDWSQAGRRLVLAPRRQRRRPCAAVICIRGDIVDGPSQEPPVRPPFAIPMLTRQRAGDQTVVQQIRRAQRSPRVKSVLVCIASGGGSATASEAMHSALAKLAAKKPVVVYMDTVAASGGYYIAVPAQRIVAHPTTLTGSIGVLTGRFAYQEFLDQRRIGCETLRLGSSAQWGIGDLTPAEESALRNNMERIYDVFVQRVAAGRNLSAEKVHAVGEGRVWTGRQALEHGLVDQLGTFNDALRLVLELGDLPADAVLLPVMAHPSMRAPQKPGQTWESYLAGSWTQLSQGSAWLLSPLQDLHDE